ncbi:redox-sensing transcriptional repressor Rex [Anaerocolumna xylanovorans]|uniref:Redox-sensing transcriptional repressor Rex n=1 Tax=Anaerocolumna xylanovorans DSM 12503 TaxID=1121345 RepID=A0A1M7XYJ0_9FIRM|nr:redox-sensing transcriptional repressor Rex [Anaerocolumna xylanovorans]SHO44096.1 redox-sensing transcriptional repressor [Anaerocolumna xylanovorans DSM 12503]
MNECNQQVITIQALQRMPYYIQQLKILKENKVETVSAPRIAELLKLNEVQVRKDFAAVYTAKGKPKTGFPVTELLNNMEELLGYHNINEAVIVGSGSLARAIITDESLQNFGLEIVAAFDLNPADAESCGVKILASDKISNLCRRMKIHIGIITVPAAQAQVVCDQLVAGGILAVWNFTPVRLSVPEYILVRNENLAASFAILSNHLKKTL